MTQAFRGELFWINEQEAFSRIVIEALEFPDKESHVYISLCSSGQGRDDTAGPYRISTRAHLLEWHECHDFDNRRVFPIDRRQKAYRTTRCQTNRHEVVARTVLELRLKLLSDDDEKRFCHVRLDWIDDFDSEVPVYSAQGLLEQCEPQYGDNFSDR